MSHQLSAYKIWATLGYLMLLTVIVLSLVRVEQPFEITHVDKFEHLLAYGSLMYWWGMVQPPKLRLWAAALPLLGAMLEWAQSLTAYRSLDWNDALANLLGVILALVLLATPAKRLLAAVDSWLAGHFADRINPRGS